MSSVSYDISKLAADSCFNKGTSCSIIIHMVHLRPVSLVTVKSGQDNWVECWVGSVSGPVSLVTVMSGQKNWVECCVGPESGPVGLVTVVSGQDNWVECWV